MVIVISNVSFYANDMKLKRLGFSRRVLTSYLTSCWHYLGESGVFFMAGTDSSNHSIGKTILKSKAMQSQLNLIRQICGACL